MKSLLEHYGRKLTAGGAWVGHVFQGRYGLKHVNRPEYLLQLSRYIHLNPVEARLARSPEEWPYSSCRSYLGIADGGFVSTGTILSLAGGQERYSEYLSGPSPTLDDELRKILMTSDVDV